MKDFLKKHWKNIAIVVFVLFSLGKCTQSCNRANEIANKENTIKAKDSAYAVVVAERDSFKHALDLSDSKVNSLNDMVGTLEKSNSTLSDVAKKETKVQIVKR